MNASIFATEAGRYDAWYDSDEGSALFQSELSAIRPMIDPTEHPGLEIGVGSGRFASALGIEYGIDPVIDPLLIARERGIRPVVGSGEALPFASRVFGTTLFAFTLCFVQDPETSLQEATRVTQSDGRIVLGIVPADGPLGRHYQELGNDGHRIYRTARFYTRSDIDDLLDRLGLETIQTRHVRMAIIDGRIVPGTVGDGDHPDAGFLAISVRQQSASN
jgi:ubiquinone/menaquinone biosynthesis C-methylase UbiE